MHTPQKIFCHCGYIDTAAPRIGRRMLRVDNFFLQSDSGDLSTRFQKLQLHLIFGRTQTTQVYGLRVKFASGSESEDTFKITIIRNIF